MVGTYNWMLVFASYCVAVIASYTAIYFGTRVFSLSGGARHFWLGMGAFCLGSGIWSMHFVGMSAYTMPMHMHMTFSATLTLLSWVPAVLASALALYVITLPKVSAKTIAASAFIMGTGIFAMHYGGMYAMQMHPGIEYDTLLVILSGVIAVVASGAALVICRKVRDVPPQYALAFKVLAALMMGAAICGMHYTGMAAASYPMGSQSHPDNLLRGDWMGIPTAIAASILLLLALYSAYTDFRAMERARQEERNRNEAARQSAFFDSLTGLANRSLLEAKVLEKLTVSATNTSPAPFMLVYFELTDYRDLWQRHGEAYAQALTKYVVTELQAQLPTAELVARYSGSSFMAIMPSNDLQVITALVQRLSSRFSAAVTINGTATRCNWGFGFSEYPKSGTNSRNLIRAAQRIRRSSSDSATESQLALV
ncbi:sensor domain-containing diguanylate cyclase [Cellvibrio mixtus]|uniref:sensor domain-containing diguanylate cyclase n=1 Tax=Cellvibrio mixtus TaxID=39650 RepID=UPI001FD27109|nr:MHYT domain-containing protein [Cellvibrio mixtus]